MYIHLDIHPINYNETYIFANIDNYILSSFSSDKIKA